MEMSFTLTLTLVVGDHMGMNVVKAAVKTVSRIIFWWHLKCHPQTTLPQSKRTTDTRNEETNQIFFHFFFLSSYSVWKSKFKQFIP